MLFDNNVFSFSIFEVHVLTKVKLLYFQKSTCNTLIFKEL